MYVATAQKLIGGFAPKLVDLTGNALFGDIRARPGLSKRDPQPHYRQHADSLELAPNNFHFT